MEQIPKSCFCSVVNHGNSYKLLQLAVFDLDSTKNTRGKWATGGTANKLAYNIFNFN